MSNALKDLDTHVFNLERVFRSHEAHLQEVPNGMEILDFYAPDNRIINSLHIVFDRRSGHVYITGDLVAWLVAIRLAWEAVRDGKAVQA